MSENTAEIPGIDLIIKHFPDLSEKQLKQFAMLGELYPEWNDRINVISRKDILQASLSRILQTKMSPAPPDVLLHIFQMT